jgi:hypothetical protein
MEPELLGAGDACGKGMGGVWFALADTNQRRHPDDGEEPRGADSTPLSAGAPLVWRAEFPQEVMSRLVTTENPTGTITNSDLELAASILQKDVVAHAYDIRERTISSGSDNIATVSWKRRRSTTTTSAPAYLLRLQAMHQQYHRYITIDYYIPGPANAMADDASCLLTLSVPELLAHFDLTYPQTTPWNFVTPRPKILSSVTLALLSKRPNSELFCQAPPPTMPRGLSGNISAPISPSIRGCKTWGTLSSSFKSLPTAIARASLLPAKDVSNLKLWKPPSARLARTLPAWGPKIPGPTRSARLTSGSGANCAATPRRTIHPTE